MSNATPAPASRWSGDIPRNALALLPQPGRSQVDGTAFVFGRFSDSQTWAVFTQEVARSQWGSQFWQADIAELDWHTHTIVYVAFDGATHLLQFHDWQHAHQGIGEFVFGARLSRRPEGIDGPCSVVLAIIDHMAVNKVRLTYHTPTRQRVSVGELVLESTAS